MFFLKFILQIVYELNKQFFALSSDYRAIPRLDVYDPTALDDEEYDQMNIGARQEAEKVMGRRDREEALTSGRLRRGLLYGTLQFAHLIFLQNGRQPLSQSCLADLTIFPVGENPKKSADF